MCNCITWSDGCYKSNFNIFFSHQEHFLPLYLKYRICFSDQNGLNLNSALCLVHYLIGFSSQCWTAKAETHEVYSVPLLIWICSMPGSNLRDLWRNAEEFESQICFLALIPQFIMSYSAKLLPPLLYLDHLTTFKALNGEECETWSCLLSLLGFICKIVLCSSLQEWCGVRLSRCEMWAQAVGEIHFLCLHRDDRETGRPSARLAITNSRWQPQSEVLASNDNVSEEVIAGDNSAKHLFVATVWNTLYHFLLDRTLSAAIWL